MNGVVGAVGGVGDMVVGDMVVGDVGDMVVGDVGDMVVGDMVVGDVVVGDVVVGDMVVGDAVGAVGDAVGETEGQAVPSAVPEVLYDVPALPTLMTSPQSPALSLNCLCPQQHTRQPRRGTQKTHGRRTSNSRGIFASCQTRQQAHLRG
jgi:hypothetical protein